MRGHALAFLFESLYKPPLSLLKRDPHQDEGNAYLRLGEVLTRLSREDEARAAYEKGTRLAEKFGHAVMAEDLRRALI